MESARLKAKLADASRQLTDTTTSLSAAVRSLGITAGDRAAAVSQSFDGVFKSLSAVVASVGDIERLIDAEAEPMPATRACPACGKRCMAAATLCGYCWTKLTAIPV